MTCWHYLSRVLLSLLPQLLPGSWRRSVSAMTVSALGRLWLQGPPVLRLLFGGLRGYRGDISPASALDASRQGNTVIVDIRTAREKESAGVPDLPSGGRLVDCEYAAISGKLRGQLRDVKGIERQVSAPVPCNMFVPMHAADLPVQHASCMQARSV